MIHVTSWGIAGRPVDHGRPGRASLGAPRGGAVDVAALSLANRLVGNPDDAVGIESSGGLSIAFDAPTMVAMAGAVAAVTVHRGPAVGWGSPGLVPAGSTLRIDRLLEGARAYLAVRGGLSACGGDRLEVGPDPRTPASSSPAPHPRFGGPVRLWTGPRLGRFAGDAWALLVGSDFVVTSTSRVGTRLRGPALRGTGTAELPSEGMVEGAVQVPPDGQPIVMLADHPTTGGYPVIAVVDPADLWMVAQAAPGTVLRFRAARPS